jgi:hypothetical protein
MPAKNESLNCVSEHFAGGSAHQTTYEVLSLRIDVYGQGPIGICEFVFSSLPSVRLGKFCEKSLHPLEKAEQLTRRKPEQSLKFTV